MTHQLADQYITVGAVKARYWAVGDQGPVLIFVHGILRFVEDWQLNIAAFASDHQVYAVDLVGHGRTDKPDIAYSADDMVEFMAGFISALGIERATLVGHSMGGGLVLNMAHRYPALVERLILVVSAGFGSEIHWGFRLAALPWLPELFVRPTHFMIAKVFREVFYDPSLITPALVDFAHEMFALPGAKMAFLRTIRFGLSLRGIQPEILAPIKAILPTLTMPTLIIWGRQDKVLPVAHAQVAADSLPNARLYILDECGHFPMLEYPRVFNALLREFLTAQAYQVDDGQPAAAPV